MILCKEPGCGAEMDTALACLDVTSLFSLRQLLAEDLADLSDDIKLFRERTKQLDYMKRQLENFGLTDEQAHPEQLKQTGGKTDVSKAPLHLRLTCLKGHRNFYDVRCNPENDNHGNQ